MTAEPSPTTVETVAVNPESVRRVAGSAWPDAYEATTSSGPLAVFHCGATVLATARFCPHKGADLVRRGLPDLDRGVLTCLAHGHTYRLTDGACVQDGTCEPLPVFRVVVDLPEESPATES